MSGFPVLRVDGSPGAPPRPVAPRFAPPDSRRSCNTRFSAIRSLTAALIGLMLMDPARAAVTQQFEGVITQRTLTAPAAGQDDACPAPIVELRS